MGKGGINGGVQWGSAADGSNVYVALSDLGRIPVPNSQATVPDPEEGGGMFAIRLDSGQRVWADAAAARVPHARTVQPRAICRRERDPWCRVLRRDRWTPSRLLHQQRLDLWDVDTVQTYKTANGVPGRGGSLNVAGPAISGGTVIINSGYVQNGMPGNVLLAYYRGREVRTGRRSPGHLSPHRHLSVEVVRLTPINRHAASPQAMAWLLLRVIQWRHPRNLRREFKEFQWSKLSWSVSSPSPCSVLCTRLQGRLRRANSKASTRARERILMARPTPASSRSSSSRTLTS